MGRIRTNLSLLRCVVFYLILSLCVSIPSKGVLAQDDPSSSKPFTLDQVVDLLKNQVREAEIKKQIEQFKVDFKLTPSNTAKLVRAGASDELLEVIENNPYTELSIIFPHKGEECGATVRVEGKSKKFSNKYLWLFAHRKGLSVWWPQSGFVSVDENGHWVQGVFLGRSQDIGFDFEIRAMWVDQKVHRQMQDYLAKGEATGQYPGIQLPEGSPATQVTVRKVRH